MSEELSLDPSLFQAPSPAYSALWAVYQTAYILAVILYLYFIVPKTVAPLVRLAARSQTCQLIARTPSLDVYSNSAGYSVGFVPRFCVQGFLIVSTGLPILMAFVITPIILLLSLYASFVVPKYNTVAPFSPSTLKSLFFTSHGKVYSVPDTQLMTRAAQEVIRNSIIETAFETGNNPFESNITVNFHTISWLMCIAITAWTIHLLQIAVAKAGFYSELGASRKWLAQQLDGGFSSPQFKLTPFLKGIISATFFAICWFSLYFLDNDEDYVHFTVHYYASHIFTFFIVQSLIFTVYASFSSVFEIREMLAISWDNMLSPYPEVTSTFPGSACIAGDQYRPDSASSISSSITLTAPVIPSRPPYTDESGKIVYRGFMTLDPSFLQQHTSSLVKLNSYTDRNISLSQIPQHSRPWRRALFFWVPLFSKLFLRKRVCRFDEEARAPSSSWVDDDWVNCTVHELSTYPCQDNAHTSNLPLTGLSCTYMPFKSVFCQFSHGKPNKKRQPGEISHLLRHTKLLVAFKNDVNGVSTAVNDGEVGFGGNSVLASAVEEQILRVICRESFYDDDVDSYRRPVSVATLVDEW